MLKIETTHDSNFTTLHLIGEVDASNSIELDEQITGLVESGAKKILVDGTKLEYISSAGLGVFMSYIEDFQENEISLVIYGLNERVYQVFRILGLDQLIKIKSDKEEALRV
ncbi:STAS domain-containing protein [Belliella kenyensis]|uniref:Anti-sigma factor antagonist n=1 Tax=Belliella kenyensis TaxID=1472724 RepID=A0ABV8ERB4_9BACT|nr:STAS domain-containing protein [Belliella kenyensis]MCH7402562.1 STAS domain-containing protein [Belliella kenyensis]MDN3603360.1 STAS domain-containing protein [Belliella kenyensis]